MQRLFPLAFTCALALLGGACTDCNGEQGDNDAGPDLALSDAEVQELCVIYSIGSGHVFESFLQPFTACSAEDRFTDVDDATQQEIEDGCAPGNFYYDIFVTARDGGRVDIDMERTRACLQKGRTARARTTIAEYNKGAGTLAGLFDDEDCQGAITPLVDEGGACVQQWDCAGDLVCQADPPDDDGALRCLGPANDGDRCGGTRVCDADLFCTDNETCAPAIAEGSDCVDDPLGGRECVVGTYCDEGGTNLCQPLLSENSECFGGDCEAGLYCEGADPFAAPPVPGTCAPEPNTVDDGEACDPEGPFCTERCSTCRPASAGGPTLCLDRGAGGAYCEADSDCRAGFGCDPGTSECTALPVVEQPGLDESCDPNVGCAEGFCVNGTCVAGEDGDPCDTNALECAADFTCVVEATAGTCVALPEAGEPCVNAICADTAFCNASDECEALKGAGVGCEGDEECVSGTCLTTSTCAAPGPSCDESREWFIQYVTLGLLLPVFARLRRRRRTAR